MQLKLRHMVEMMVVTNMWLSNNGQKLWNNKQQQSENLEQTHINDTFGFVLKSKNSEY